MSYWKDRPEGSGYYWLWATSDGRNDLEVVQVFDNHRVITFFEEESEPTTVLQGKWARIPEPCLCDMCKKILVPPGEDWCSSECEDHWLSGN